MSDFFNFLSVFATCGTVFFVAMLVLLALPKSKLRSIALELMKYAFAAGLFLLLPSPVDVIPDVLPLVGWADDLAYLIGGVAAVKSGLKDRKQRAFEQECENARLARLAHFDVPTPPAAGGTSSQSAD